MRLSDRVTGSFLILLGAAAAYGGSRLPPVPGQQVGPNVFPLVVGLGLCLCGGLIAVGVGRHFEEEAEADLTAHADVAATQPVSFWRGLMALVPPALLLFYVLSVDRLGFLVSAATIVFVAALALGGRLRLAVPVAIGGPLFVHLVFSKLLRVPLPSGLVAPPW